MRLGILGGTFDPIHQGHLFLAQKAQAQYRLDKVLFIPAFIPPHKTARRDMTPAPYRYKMAELALQKYPDFEVSDIEFNRPDISYTVDTLRLLKRKYPQAEFFLIVGEDSAAEFQNWKDFEDIRKMAVITAAHRPGYGPVPDREIQWIDMPECGVSSSEIRRRIAAGEQVGTDILPEEVASYMKQTGIYQKVKT